jgi:Hypothetical glycosyl hydrolase family 15
VKRLIPARMRGWPAAGCQRLATVLIGGALIIGAPVNGAAASVGASLGASDFTAPTEALGAVLEVTAETLRLITGEGSGSSPVAQFSNFNYRAPDLRHRYGVSALEWNGQATEIATELAQVHSRYPSEKVLTYMAPVVSETDPAAYRSCLPWNRSYKYGAPSSILMTVGRTPVYNGTYNFFQLDFASPVVQQDCVNQIEATMRAVGNAYDGVFLDFGPATPQYSGVPGGCQQWECRSQSNWKKAVEAFYAYVAAQIHRFKPGALVLANIAGGAYCVPPEGAERCAAQQSIWATYLSSGLDGAMEESFVYSTHGDLLTPPELRSELQNVAWDESHNKVTLLNADLAPAYDTQKNTFTLAMMLLVAGGNTEWVVNDGVYGQTAAWHPVYHAARRLGPPLGPGVALDGGTVYARRFGHGWVEVNLSSTPVPALFATGTAIPAQTAAIEVGSDLFAGSAVAP